MSETVERLRHAQGLAWAELQPAFDWAIHEAIEAEWRADVASDAVQAGIAPTYPTIVRLLADSITYKGATR